MLIIYGVKINNGLVRVACQNSPSPYFAPFSVRSVHFSTFFAITRVDTPIGHGTLASPIGHFNWTPIGHRKVLPGRADWTPIGHTPVRRPIGHPRPPLEGRGVRSPDVTTLNQASSLPVLPALHTALAVANHRLGVRPPPATIVPVSQRASSRSRSLLSSRWTRFRVLSASPW